MSLPQRVLGSVVSLLLAAPVLAQVAGGRSIGVDDDPVLGQFLGFLARDMASHPERLRALDAGLVQRLQSLVGGIEVDLDAALTADDE